MPKCKNNPLRHYKGTEPSPKGLGWCASGESIGKKRKGKDGNMWIIQKTKKSKRWVRLKSCKSTEKKSRKRKYFNTSRNTLLPKTKKSSQTLDFRMVIGYFKQEQYAKDNDDRPFASKKALEKMIRTQKVWDSFNIDLGVDDQPVFGRKHLRSIDAYPVRLGKIRSKNVKSVKVMKVQHNPTVWEKLIKKHNAWWYNPDWVIVVDLKNVPTIPVTKEKAVEYMKLFKVVMRDTIDQRFFDELLHMFNHQSLSGPGWINQWNFRTKRYDQKQPFKGDLSLLQCGLISTTVPDYKKFHI